MRVAVKLFAIARERAGTTDAWVELAPDATVTDALDELGRCFPKLPSVLTRAMVAVNREYAERTHALHDGDELAVIPPVSGGAAFCHSCANRQTTAPSVPPPSASSELALNEVNGAGSKGVGSYSPFPEGKGERG
ncbi:MAG: hypothetical protein EXR47_03610 [Dehalococcoidia bacterium]|nr:hypothetical protein [Dehalococcoidia bacterium]